VLPYHAIAHQRCAELLARVEADWRSALLHAEPADGMARDMGARPSLRRHAALRRLVERGLRRIQGQPLVRPL
jgi:hypothetical protein